ncbi:MAG TPA: hypothetical protein VNF68_00585, partial [Candidatus Baltobacteraceae bacterium]|nr:hypothetical protein [Candidatus Baltobacteraceae bacterium]
MPRLYKGTTTIPFKEVPVSANVHAPHSGSRNLLFGDLQSAGPLLFALVGLAGFTLGFFAWVGYVVPLHDGALSQLGLPVFTLGGIATVLLLWQRYARYFSRRSGATFSRSLRYDAFTWAPFVLLWLAFLLPPALTHGGSRIFVVCAAFFCIAKVLI